MNYRKYLSIPLFVALFLPAAVFAHPDSGTCRQDSHSGVQNLNSTLGCDSQFPNTTTITAVEIYISTNTLSGSASIKLSDGISTSCTDVSSAIIGGGTGLKTLTFDAPYTIQNTAAFQGVISNSPDCTSATPSNTIFALAGDTDGFPYMVWSFFGDTSTRIIDFTPEDGTTTPSAVPVVFSMHAYINPADTAGQYKIKLILHNIDQNVLLLSQFSPADIYLIGTRLSGGETATTSGDFYFSTSTYIGDGNYRLNAILEQDAFYGFIRNPFFPVQNLSHQYIVGSSTFIGNISQNLWRDLNTSAASSSATSTAALLARCNPLSNFDVASCVYGMFIPDPEQIGNLVENFKTGVASHAPWGYIQRLYAIVNASSTAPLPTFTASIPTGPGSEPFAYTTVSFNPGEMLAGGATLLESVHDPIDNKSPHDIFYPMVQLSVALMVILTISADVMASHRHHTEEGRGKKA